MRHSTPYKNGFYIKKLKICSKKANNFTKYLSDLHLVLIAEASS